MRSLIFVLLLGCGTSTLPDMNTPDQNACIAGPKSGGVLAPSECKLCGYTGEVCGTNSVCEPRIVSGAPASTVCCIQYCP